MQKQHKQKETTGQHLLNETMNLVGNTAGAVIGTGVLLTGAGAIGHML